MVTQTDLVLRDVIDNVRQITRFDQMGRETKVVEVAFTTPHGFTGTVKMPLSDWTNPDIRAKKVFQAVFDLEGPFMEPEGQPPEIEG